MIIPKHIAIILDGNGKWSELRKQSRIYGHVKGCENIDNICYICKKNNIKYLTIFVFSTENWKRSDKEIYWLMLLFYDYLKKCLNNINENKMSISVIGEISIFNKQMCSLIKKIEKKTNKFKKFHLQIALNYGGRNEIKRSIEKILINIKNNNLNYKITENMITQYLDTYKIPDPDLLIRTGGEKRISNFFVWQLSYTELYFTDILWPDFGKREFKKAIIAFNTRKRKYGSNR